MKAIERLKRDHAILRSKLDVLEAGLRMGPATWFVLREVSLTLSRQFTNHMRREEELVMACRKAMHPKMLAEVAVEHHDEPEHLRVINQLFVRERGHTLERIRPELTAVIEGLRCHMTQEERELFPLLERVLGAREPLEAREVSQAHLHECMTVNRIVHDYPTTKPVFERFFVSIPYEGCDCLDEVAWRHGMESQELLDQLEQAIPPGKRSRSDMEKDRERCGCR